MHKKINCNTIIFNPFSTAVAIRVHCREMGNHQQVCCWYRATIHYDRLRGRIFARILFLRENENEENVTNSSSRSRFVLA